MTQYIHLDTETTGSQINGDILSLTAIKTNENMQPVGEEFDVLAKPRKSRAYDVDAYLVNNIDPFVADTHPLTNFQLVGVFCLGYRLVLLLHLLVLEFELKTPYFYLLDQYKIDHHLNLQKYDLMYLLSLI